MKFPQCVWIVAAIGLLAGCQSLMNQRISAHQEAWSKLSETDRHRLKQGQVRAGDTEEIVQIVLGPPDRVLPTTGPDGQKQTLWLYDVLEVFGDPLNLNSATDFADREQNVVFQNGMMVEQWMTGDRGMPPRIRKTRAEIGAEHMLTQLDLLVALTPEQKVDAHAVFLKAGEELDRFNVREHREIAGPILRKMRVEIRAILTAEQQAKYDTAPRPMGGVSTKQR